jgi:hypothetical protein
MAPKAPSRQLNFHCIVILQLLGLWTLGSSKKSGLPVLEDLDLLPWKFRERFKTWKIRKDPEKSGGLKKLNTLLSQEGELSSLRGKKTEKFIFLFLFSLFLSFPTLLTK